MSAQLPINPEILVWARTTAGFSIEEVVKRINRKRVGKETVESWERGDSTPSYTQLERLAYEIYRRPLAIFFFPKAPDEESPQQAFRTLPDAEASRLSPRIHLLLRKALVLQLNLKELHDGINPAGSQIVRDIHFDLDTPVSELAQQVRIYLGVTLDQQHRWKSPEIAFKEWRNILEMNGIFIFKNAFQENDVSGFCLHDPEFPIMYVNNSRAFTHQIFTLFHELAHLLSGTGGIDTDYDFQYIPGMQGRNKQVEILCNSFAGAFLVPQDDFRELTRGILVDEQSIGKFAKRYNVSREVILRRFVDENRASRDFYSALTTKWRNEFEEQIKNESNKQKKMGGSYYSNQGVYLGQRYISVVLTKYYQSKISIEQAADYLGVKVKNIPGIESLSYFSEAAQ